ncbi:MAG: hypothetical protein AB7I79_00170 [Rhizobiaceae bacterium]
MIRTTSGSSIDPALEDAVNTAFSGLSGQDVVSTRAAIGLARARNAMAHVTDDQIVERIVAKATGRTMPVMFDHR